MTDFQSALLALQQELPVVPKGNRADTGKYSYQYAGLPEVWHVVKPYLKKHGFVFVCCPAVTDRGPVIEGRLVHAPTGEQVTGTVPLAGATPQDQGKAMTYMRRYLLGCLTGLVTDEDTDGSLQDTINRARPTLVEPPITAQQANKIADLWEALEFTAETAESSVTWASHGRTTDPTELTTNEADRLITTLTVRVTKQEPAA